VQPFIGVSPPRLFHRGSFPPTNMPSADSSHAIRFDCSKLSSWQHVRPPGVNTHLSAHERAPSIPAWPIING
ncbi:MAG: hypothetical protein KAI50_11885, partial [Desulfobacterales bacterium]|nr:hypothetical protein [Desulfobacterales bacterium]